MADTLHELDVLETRRIAELAADARKVRDSLLEKVRDAALGEPEPARGHHNPAGDIVLNGFLAGRPEFVALRQAIVELPRDIREKLWVVAQIGRGDAARANWDAALAATATLTDADIADTLSVDADLHNYLEKGLYELGVAAVAGG